LFRKGLKDYSIIRGVASSMSVAGKYVFLKRSPFNRYDCNLNHGFYEEKYIISFEKYKKCINYINELYNFDFQEQYFKDINKLKEYYYKNNSVPAILIVSNNPQIDKYSYVPLKTKCICGKNLQQKNTMSHFNHKCKINKIKNEIKKLIEKYGEVVKKFDYEIYEYKEEDFTEYNIENINKLKRHDNFIKSYYNLICDYKELLKGLQDNYTKKELNTAIASFKKHYYLDFDVKNYDYELFLDTIIDCESFLCKVKNHIVKDIKNKIKEIKENINFFVKECECNICLDTKKCREVDCCNKPICEDCETGIKDTQSQSQKCPYCRNTNW